MKKVLAILCVAAMLINAAPLFAQEEEVKGEQSQEEPTYEEEGPYSEEFEPYEPKKKSVGMAAMLSVAPSFGAGLYYAGEYYMAISSTLGMATGLALLLDGLLRTNNDGTVVTGITLLGTSWLLGVIYAPLSVHEYNKSLDEEYALRPFVGTSGKSLYAGISGHF